MTTNNQEWEEEYKKLLNECWNKYGEGCEIYSDEFFVDIESFLRQEIAKAEERGYNKGFDKGYEIGATEHSN